eukprot:scaffold8005_cov275-Amphora_coffeaeformis.AAC.24
MSDANVEKVIIEQFDETWSTVHPQDDTVRYLLGIGLKHPKHGHTRPIAVIGRQHARVHFAFKRRIGRLFLFEAMDEKVFGFGKGGAVHGDGGEWEVLNISVIGEHEGSLSLGGGQQTEEEDYENRRICQMADQCE